MWTRQGEVLCARTVVRFWKTTSLCPRSSLLREVEEFHLLWVNLSLLMVRISSTFTHLYDSCTRNIFSTSTNKVLRSNKETNQNIYKVQSEKIQSHSNPASVFNFEESFLCLPVCKPLVRFITIALGLFACSVFVWDRGSKLTFSMNEI